ncbi:hypothetical protein HX900_26100 [Rhizobium sp. WYCCWR 11290]|uniref:Uncharacterized protein n=1 Tax=Rhizobium changzhiense TaxID=2692317 RepID=A0A7Z0UEY2_9HYPH|nr:hypothetical protein [Rhizobium changzhiense]NZD64550.1 hypothetical protein [Rhizobium changzhiense]
MQENIDWLFDVGQVVQFHDMIGTVLGRDISALGGCQHFYIEFEGESHGRPLRTVRGQFLVAA